MHDSLLLSRHGDDFTCIVLEYGDELEVYIEHLNLSVIYLPPAESPSKLQWSNLMGCMNSLLATAAFISFLDG